MTTPTGPDPQTELAEIPLLDGHFESLCPPYVSDMREAVNSYISRKFGFQGAYDPATLGPWHHTRAIKARRQGPTGREPA